MNLLATSLTLAALLSSSAPDVEGEKGGPTYSDKRTQRIVKKMVKAHGGLEAFRDAPSIRYEHEMLDPQRPNDPWISNEVHHPETRKAYHDWPRDEARLGFDGEHVWSVDWKRQNPPSMMSGVSFFFLCLPWITQDAGAHLQVMDKKKVAEIDPDRSLLTVRLTFEDASEFEYYELYIDPRSSLLVGVEYTVTSPAMLRLFGAPPEQEFIGPLLKVYAKHTEVQGLVLPARYDTYVQGRRYGLHWARNYELDLPFDEERARIPEDGVVDESETVRR